jgi:opacity protein-like surface antigen|nr:DUF748 domain-containing protein [Kofleriaceae bacterium]
MKTSLVAATALVAALSSVALADATPPAPPATAVYKLDISISGLDADPKAAPATYSLAVEEGNTGTLETGANIAVGGASSQMRMNVGLKLGMHARMHGSTLVIAGDVEMSTVDSSAPAQSNIHRIRAEGATAAALDKSAQLASVYDPQSKRRYDITVTAHRVL